MHLTQTLGEQIYTTTLTNGLQVMLLPQPDFHQTYAMLTVKYGSLDDEFTPYDQYQTVKLPAGVVHFLEHKVFEKADYDAFELFSKNGADANAFTTYDKTSFLFTATQNLHANIDILLDTVQTPYFTEQTVNKEKGIIAQEINMYVDDPDWQLFMQLMRNLYPHHPLSHDVAGTVASVQQITAHDLLCAYNNFYVPNNMQLLMTGNFDVHQVSEWIAANQAQRHLLAHALPHIAHANAVATDIVAHTNAYAAIARPKCIIGVKNLVPFVHNQSGMRLKIMMNLLLDMLLGDDSDNYIKLYQQRILDDTFGYEFSITEDASFVAVSGDTDDAAQFIDALQILLQHAATNNALNEAHLQRVKKANLGAYLRSFNSLSSLANQIVDNQYQNVTFFDIAKILMDISLNEIKALAQRYFVPRAFSTVTLLPQED